MLEDAFEQKLAGFSPAEAEEPPPRQQPSGGQTEQDGKERGQRSHPVKGTPQGSLGWVRARLLELCPTVSTNIP